MSSLGQKHGCCGHVTALLDGHSRCTHCRDKGQRSDTCVLHQECLFCNAVTPEQVRQLVTPTYQIRKERKAKGDKNLDLMYPSDVTVIPAIASEAMYTGTVSTKKLYSSPSQQFSSDTSSVKQDLVDLDEWAEKFARIEALLTRGMYQPVYSPVRMHVPHPHGAGVLSRSPILQPPVSDPFLPAGPARIRDRSPDKVLKKSSAEQLDRNVVCKSPLQHLCLDRSPVLDEEQEPLFQQTAASDEPVGLMDKLEEGIISDSEDTELDTDQDRDLDPDKTVTED